MADPLSYITEGTGLAQRPAADKGATAGAKAEGTLCRGKQRSGLIWGLATGPRMQPASWESVANSHKYFRVTGRVAQAVSGRRAEGVRAGGHRMPGQRWTDLGEHDCGPAPVGYWGWKNRGADAGYAGRALPRGGSLEGTPSTCAPHTLTCFPECIPASSGLPWPLCLLGGLSGLFSLQTPIHSSSLGSSTSASRKPSLISQASVPGLGSLGRCVDGPVSPPTLEGWPGSYSAPRAGLGTRKGNDSTGA